MSIPDTKELCGNLGYECITGHFEDMIGNEYDDSVFLLCGAGLLGEEFVSRHRIINAHPGYSPLARGLDAYKWSIWYDLSLGVTTHLIGEYVDAGEVIERRDIKIYPYDTFHSVAQRIYENEIDMLVGAIDRIDDEHEMIIPPEGSELFKRMPEEKEIELFERFDGYKNKHSVQGGR